MGKVSQLSWQRGQYASAKHDLDLDSAFLIGDRWSDIVAAHAAGCRAVLIETPFSNSERCRPDHSAPDIATATEWILATAEHERAARSAA